MWTDWINYESNGIQCGDTNYMIDLMYIEDFSEIQYTQKAAEYALNIHQSDFMFGPYSTKLTSACVAITDAANMTVISAGSTVTSIYKNSQNLIGMLPSSYKYTQVAFQTLSEFGARSVAVMVDKDLPLCANSSSILYADMYNLTLFGHFSVDPSSLTYADDVSSILSLLKDSDVEAVLGCSLDALCAEVGPAGIDRAYCACVYQ